MATRIVTTAVEEAVELSSEDGSELTQLFVEQAASSLSSQVVNKLYLAELT